LQITKRLKSLLFETIYNYIEEGIAFIDRNGTIIYYNRQMAELEGLEQEEVIEKHLWDIFPTFNPQNSTIMKAFNTGEPVINDEQHYLNNKGKKISAVVTDIPIVDRGEVIGVIEIARDIYKSKNLYDAINRIQGQEECPKKSSKEKALSLYTFDDFKTQDEQLLKLIERTKKISASDSNVLIYGETGTGKEIFAQSIHSASKRRNMPFIAQNCAAIPENLLESILFGTVKGSFTGALDRPGLFEQADGGTILLDELNSMPYTLQGKFLRVLEEGVVRRVGAIKENRVDVRVIATVNKEPLSLIEKKVLRDDLFYRLSVISIHIPPLRARREDILWLADFFIEKHKHISRKKSPKLSKEVKKAFLNYSWNGNVRELENVIESALNVVGEEEEIKIEHFPYYLIDRLTDVKHQELIKSNVYKTYNEVVENFEKKIISDALNKADGNVSKAAKILNIKRQTLQHKLKKFKIN